MLINVIFIHAQITLIPDTNFENHLISQGFDSGVLDGMVLTTNIDTITHLYIMGNGFNQITDLTGIEDFTALTDLNCKSNDLISLSFTQNLNLTNLVCDENASLTTLDVTQNSVLTLLTCSINSLTTIDLSNNPLLSTLVCGSQWIRSIDVSNNPALTSFDCSVSSLLTCINIKNGNNMNITSFSAWGNPILSCIEVDNPSWSTSNWTNIDAGVAFSNYCNNGCSICNIIPGFTTVNNGSGNYTFTNTSITPSGPFSGPSGSKWNFGDGTLLDTSIQTSPNHTFLSNGTFIVVLAQADTVPGVVPNGECWNHAIDTITVTGVSSPLQCLSGFSFYPDSVTNNIIVSNSSTGNNLTYLWDFGDGSTSTLQNPSHTYTSTGPFYLCLTVDDGAGCNDMFCDSIGVNGVVFKQAGFAINVIPPTLITGINNEIELNSITTIYPNPNNGAFTVTLGQLIDGTKVEVLNSLGQQIWKQENINDLAIPVTLKEATLGIYFIKISNIEGVNTKKIIIN